MIVCGRCPTQNIGSRYGITVAYGYGRVFGQIVSAPFRLGKAFVMRIRREVLFKVSK
jgi:hypothetical protein